MANDLINHASVMKPPEKPTRRKSSESFLVDEHMEIQERLLPESMEAPRPFPTPCPMYLFHLTAPELYPFIIYQ